MELPPLDAGAAPAPASAPSPLPDPEPEPAPTPDTEPDDDPDTGSGLSPEVGQDPDTDGGANTDTDDGDVDPEILAALDSSDTSEGQPAQPPGVSSEQWQQFQAWQQQQAQLLQQQQPQPQQQPAPFEVTPEDFDSAFADAQGLGNLLGKAQAASAQQAQQHIQQMAAQVSGALQEQWQRHLEATEEMLYLHEAIRDNPEIVNYQTAFKRALAKARTQNPDVRGHVQDAVKMLKRAVTTADSIKATQKKGRVDVRGNKSAPKTAGSSARGVHRAAGRSGDDRGLGFLADVVGGR